MSGAGYGQGSGGPPPQPPQTPQPHQVPGGQGAYPSQQINGPPQMHAAQMSPMQHQQFYPVHQNYQSYGSGMPIAYSVGGAGPSSAGPMYHQGPSAAGPMYHQGPSAAGPMYQQGPSYLVAGAGSPYFHFPAPGGKRGPGRPPGSKNRRKAADDQDYAPPQTRSKKATFQAVRIPEVHDWDYEIATHESAACSKCNLNKAMFLVQPCYHYGFCLECLQRLEFKCRDADVIITCMGCDVPVEEYVKYYRATLTN